MSKSMIGVKVAVLAANGVDEKDLTSVQRALAEAGATMRIISTDQGLVNGWDGQGWGHNHAVDTQLNSALGVDYDALVIPGGQRSLDKLRLTAHTRRFIGSFMGAMKPVAVMGDALALMVFAEQLNGKAVTGPEGCEAMAIRAGANWSNESIVMDGALLTGLCDDDSRAAYISTMIELFEHNTTLQQAA